MPAARRPVVEIETLPGASPALRSSARALHTVLFQSDIIGSRLFSLPVTFHWPTQKSNCLNSAVSHFGGAC
jgi:hypothetical protein